MFRKGKAVSAPPRPASFFSPMPSAGMGARRPEGRTVTRLAKKALLIVPVLVMVSLVSMLTAAMAREPDARRERRRAQ